MPGFESKPDHSPITTSVKERKYIGIVTKWDYITIRRWQNLIVETIVARQQWGHDNITGSRRKWDRKDSEFWQQRQYKLCMFCSKYDKKTHLH
jgi:hypothetical protein